jgi:hypothetical protein
MISSSDPALPGLKKVIVRKNEKGTFITEVYLKTGERGIAYQAQNDVTDPFVGLAVAYTHAISGHPKKALKTFSDQLAKDGVNIFKEVI